MTDADPAFWAGHAPLLFPIVGRLNGDVLRVEGCEYAMPQHGFARRMAWDIMSVTKNSVAFHLSDTEATREQYPFDFALTVHYTLEANRLSVTAQVFNPGSRSLPFCFGFHPAFAWPLPDGGDKAAHSIVFDEAEPQDICRLDANSLLARRETTPISGKTLSLQEALFDDGAIIWDHLASRRLAYRSNGGPWLEIEFGLPYLGVWQKPGANFICIEPWAGLADPPEFTGDLADKAGIILLPPGDWHQFAMNVAVHEF